MNKDDVKEMSNEELLEIIIKGENSNIPGSLNQRATTEYAIRQQKREQAHQDNLLSHTTTRLDRIIKLLEFLVSKPKQAAIYAALFAICVGTAINILTEIILKFLKLK